VLTGVVEVAK